MDRGITDGGILVLAMTLMALVTLTHDIALLPELSWL